jgi:hypothetical protein
MKPKNPDDEEDAAEAQAAKKDVLEDRTKEWSNYKYIQEQLGEIWTAVSSAYDDKQEMNNTVTECWDIYNCSLNGNQGYVGNSKVYVPIVKDAINARETRFINMLFPGGGRITEITGEDGHPASDLTALMDTYIHMAKMRTKVVPALIRTGDIGGNYDLFVEWLSRTRHVTSKKKVSEVETDGGPVEEADKYDDVEYEEVKDDRPDVTVLDPRDLIILPVTCDDIEDAEIVAVGRNFTKAKIKRWVKDGIFDEDVAEEVLAHMSTQPSRMPDTGKDAASAAGVRTTSKGNKVVRIQHVWCTLKLRGGERRRMLVHFAGKDSVLSCKRNPYWCDRVPVIHKPVEKNPNGIWGSPLVNEGVRQLQYKANDTVNEGFDSAEYALLPIVMTDPDKNPRAGSMVLAMASVWLCDPNSTKFAEFPPLWKDAFMIVGSCKEQIFQSLSVNPAMIPHGNAGKKPSQAQIAQEQQVALESSSDNSALIQEGILSELIEWFYEMDYQYRTEAITVKKWGMLGIQATMDQVEPFQVRSRFEFKWYGTEGFKAQQQVQAMISWCNVLKELPPQALNGRKLDLSPAIEVINATILGPRIAPRVLIDQRHQLTMSAETENKLLEHEFPVQVHEMDDDRQHIESHFHHFEPALKLPPEMLEVSNLMRIVKGHILEHVKAMKMKAQMAMGAQPGQVGGPGQPRAGAQVQAPTGGQAPPGAVRPDNMPLAMPRKA